ncbi:MAG TPA: TOBE domain-containing protein [Methylococcus sp.]|nr:TOBE domain-containing protein [Methylococcus sp.]
MKASARNRFFGTVTDVQVGSVYDEIVIGLKGGQSIVATITKESAEKLGIRVGSEVVALVKASEVIVVTDTGGYRLSARNRLSGTVSRIFQGVVTAEVVIDLPGGDSVTATITNESVESLGLQEGQPATAVFKAGSVVLGIGA